MTKAQRANYTAYLRSSDYNLYDCYESFSSKKAKAWEYCKDLCSQKSGKALKVVSHNGWMFTAGFLFEEDGKKYFMYITPSRDEVIEITEEE